MVEARHYRRQPQDWRSGPRGQAARQRRAVSCRTTPGTLSADVALVYSADEVPQTAVFDRLFPHADPRTLGFPRQAHVASWRVSSGPGRDGFPPLRELPIALQGATSRGHLVATLPKRDQRPPCGGESGAPVYVEDQEGLQVAGAAHRNRHAKKSRRHPERQVPILGDPVACQPGRTMARLDCGHDCRL